LGSLGGRPQSRHADHLDDSGQASQMRSSVRVDNAGVKAISSFLTTTAYATSFALLASFFGLVHGCFLTIIKRELMKRLIPAAPIQRYEA